MILALPHVPLDRHREAVGQIYLGLNYFRELSHESPESELFYRKLVQYHNYLTSTWMEGSTTQRIGTTIS